MSGQIGATAYLGIAHESTYATYAAPTRFFPIKSCSLKEVWAHKKRRLIRGIADNMGSVPGFHHVEGDIVMELYPDVLPYFLYVMRVAVTKTGADPYTYTTAPLHIGDSADLPDVPGMSVTLYRGGEINGFAGCVVSQMSITIEDGIPMVTFSMVGSSESDQSDPTASFLATDLPFTAGSYDIQVPSASTITSVENFTFRVNDNVEPQFRLNDTGAAQWMKFGEREVMLEVTKDFESRAEWDLYKAVTGTTGTIVLTRGSKTVTIVLPNATRETYEIGDVSDQGSPIMATVNYEGDYDPTDSVSYEIEVAGTITDIS